METVSGKGCEFDDGGGLYDLTCLELQKTRGRNQLRVYFASERALGTFKCYLLDNATPTAGFTSQFTWFVVHLVVEEK